VSEDKLDKLVRMANQIADNFRLLPEPEAAASTADHLRRFWTPKMCGEIAAVLERGGQRLSPIAMRAVAALTNRSSP
jgi:formate dehydrogenase subunit delta